MAVKTLRPKKNDRPQSKAQFAPPALQSLPPKVLKAVLEPLLFWNSVSAFSMLKLTDTGELMFVPWFWALRLSGEVVGQYHEFWSLHVAGTPGTLLLRKNSPLEPLSRKLAG